MKCLALFLLAFAVAPLPAQPPTEVTLQLSEQRTLAGDLYRSSAAPDALAILLFHQGGGDARGEYADIIPRLLAQQFHVLSVDVTGGGERFGPGHRAPSAPEGFRYCDAYGEVDAALSLARANGLEGPLILWGSSYTATLVIQAAARRSADVRAVLSFSPAGGELLEECRADLYGPWLARAGTPLFITRSTEELADPAVRERFDRLVELGGRSFIAEGGGHGSSMLVAARVRGDVTPLWSAVLAFLEEVRTPRPADASAEPLVIASDEWRLTGDLTLPQASNAARSPVVLLLNKAAGSRAVYRDLATRLAARGIASLRVDLRAHGGSTNRGRFVPHLPATRPTGEHDDVRRALETLRARSDIDGERIAIVAASYSAEQTAVALRQDPALRLRAVVALSPGDFSDESFAALRDTDTAWLFVRGDAERFVGAWLDEKIRAHAEDADLWILPTGSAHATDLLLADPSLSERIAEWLVKSIG